jgi:hypothetical protein
LLATGCKPNLDQTVSVVSEPIVLAVRSDPAEMAPAGNVQMTALYVDRNGPIAAGRISWAFCTARNPLANLGDVNPECLETSGAWFVPLGSGASVMGAIPDNACQQFGPDVPQPTPGQPQGRPVDPDPTGGYYQPARLLLPSDAGTSVSIAETRLSCGPGLATGDPAVDFNRRYHANVNPAVAGLAVVQGSSTSPWGPDDTGDAGAPTTNNTVKAGAHVSLRVSWAACPMTDRCGDGLCGPDESMQSCPADCTQPMGCTGAERFVTFNIPSQADVDTREAMGVSWFATGGAFDDDSTGRESTDMTTSSDNGWTAPAQSGAIHFWIVLRDSRGGAGWAQYTVLVQ